MIKIKKNNDVEKKEIILAQLKAYNRKKCRWLHDYASLDSTETETNNVNFFATDGSKLVGGAIEASNTIGIS